MNVSVSNSIIPNHSSKVGIAEITAFIRASIGLSMNQLPRKTTIPSAFEDLRLRRPSHHPNQLPIVGRIGWLKAKGAMFEHFKRVLGRPFQSLLGMPTPIRLRLVETFRHPSPSFQVAHSLSIGILWYSISRMT